jgi:ATP-binding cassette subfamily F protein uup
VAAALVPVALPSTASATASSQDRAAQKAMARLERQIEKLRVREVALHDELATHATDFARVTTLHDQLRDVESEREHLEEQWLELVT